jgi:hypothetical protein
VDTEAIVGALKPIWKTKYPTAKRLRNCIERILNYAAVQRLRTRENPARWRGHLEYSLSKPAATERKHHAAYPWLEMGAFMARLRAPPPDNTLNLDALALEF